jgi:hypothetical protein
LAWLLVAFAKVFQFFSLVVPARWQQVTRLGTRVNAITLLMLYMFPRHCSMEYFANYAFLSK